MHFSSQQWYRIQELIIVAIFYIIMETVFICLQGLTLSSEAKSLEYLLSDIGIPAPPVLKSEELTMVNTL